jgi:hypothetical protein
MSPSGQRLSLWAQTGYQRLSFIVGIVVQGSFEYWLTILSEHHKRACSNPRNVHSQLRTNGVSVEK